MTSAEGSSLESKPSKGWGWPTLSRKAHYFVEGRAICGKWLFFGDVEESSPGPDDCAACRRKWESTYKPKEKSDAATK